MVVKRQQETFEPVTMGHIRSLGCRDLLVYCISGRCHHSAALNGDWLPDETPLRSLCSRMVYTRCGMIGADVRPDTGTACQQEAWLINPTIFLPRLASDLKRTGVPFRRRLFADMGSFAEIRENIIINCTGYGAKALVQDNQLLARRGHLVILRKTQAKQFYFFSGGCANHRTMYVFCRQADIVVGGTVQDVNESETPGPEDETIFRRIRENARNVFDGQPRQCR
jgi:FAD dependent oxidoreductase